MSGHPDPDLRDRLAAHALGALDSREHAEVEAHLESCPDCRRALADCVEAVVALARSAPAAAPSAALRERVLEAARTSEARKDEEMRPPRGRAWLGWAAAAVLAGVAALGWLRYFDARGQLASRQVEVQTLAEELAAARQRLEKARLLPTLLAANAVELIRVGPSADAGATALTARIAYDPATSRGVAVFDVVRTPERQDYELWALGPGGPRSLGLVPTGDAGAGEVVVDLEVPFAAAQLQGFAVSLEPEGGSPGPGPSGPVVAVGTRG